MIIQTKFSNFSKNPKFFKIQNFIFSKIHILTIIKIFPFSSLFPIFLCAFSCFFLISHALYVLSPFKSQRLNRISLAVTAPPMYDGVLRWYGAIAGDGRCAKTISPSRRPSLTCPRRSPAPRGRAGHAHRGTMTSEACQNNENDKPSAVTVAPIHGLRAAHSTVVPRLVVNDRTMQCGLRRSGSHRICVPVAPTAFYRETHR